jgi:hypothetical protein
MGETSATAMLVGTQETFAARSSAVTATVSRHDIEAALSMDPPAELVLEVLRPSEGASDADKHIVHVAWKRTDLESLLDLPASDAITFSFDAEELERALHESDVEGHGLREAAAVLTIAAAAAMTGVSSAAAEPHGAAYTTPAQVATGGHEEMTFAARGIEPAAPAATHEEMSFAARGIEPAAPAATHEEMSFAARGIEPAAPAATHEEMSFAARGIEPTAPAAIHDEMTFAARGIESGSPQVAGDTTSGLEFPSVDSGTVAGIAGGLAGAGLLIAAAAFATTRRREPGRFA